MCDDCGCGDPEKVPVEIHESLLGENDRVARHNREHFDARGVLALNLMGSPGSGKTALLEATMRAHSGLRMAAVSGDLATDHDARRLEAAGIPARSITTGSACHLDAKMVHHSLHHMPLDDLDLFVIENVGNLVCPAIYDLGQHFNVVALAVTEGEDKPLKYPVMFRKADLVVLTKIDLVPHLGVDLGAIEDALAHTMPEPRMIAVSARSGEGMDRWLAWLDARSPVAARQAAASGA
jgi:hydrogenase nickel incorporation protein HypB